MKINRISQQHLNILETCPRKFEYLYLHGLNLPLDPEKQDRIKFGNQFHLLMQQKELGLDISPILTKSQDLADCFQSLEKSAAEILKPEILENDHISSDQFSHQSTNSLIFRQAEYNLNLTYKNYIITVIYDLLITDHQSAHIYDWKTYPLPENSKKIIENWQTRLYLFLLAEASDYSPENISMTYWFIKSNKSQKAECLKISYDHNQHEKNRQDLDNLLEKLTNYLNQQQTDQKPFPQVNVNLGICAPCQFLNRCHNQQLELNLIHEKIEEDAINTAWLNIHNIPEISI
jgi:hypothetical protein